MGYLDEINQWHTRLTRRDAKAASTGVPAPRWALAGANSERYDLPGGEHFEQQARLYARLSWVQIAINIVAETAAANALQVKQRQGEKTKAIENHPFELLLEKPNPMDSRFEFLTATFSYRRLSGNAYWWLNRSTATATPDELWLIPSTQITPVPDGNLYLRGYLYEPGDGSKIPLEPWEVVHFKSFNPLSRFIGLSPIEALWVSAMGDVKAQEWNHNFFSKYNAKLGGLLTFADTHAKPDWDRLRAEVASQHGGTKNAMLMMLNGVGKSGVEFIKAGLSQDEMQFMELRQFTKEEIFAMYAPGLAPMIAVNANEASGRTGDMVLNAKAIYPLHVAVAEKVTLSILPAYGQNLVAEFDDVRHKDRQLELQEQQQAEHVMTLDQLRERYYDLEPIGDERGKLLYAEIGKGMTDGRAPEDKPPPPPPLAPFQPHPQHQQQPPQLTQDAPTPDTSAMDTQPAEEAAMANEDQQAKAADLARWERKARKALKAGKTAAVAFEPDALSEDEAAAIRARLASVTDETALKAAFDLKADVEEDDEAMRLLNDPEIMRRAWKLALEANPDLGSTGE